MNRSSPLGEVERRLLFGLDICGRQEQVFFSLCLSVESWLNFACALGAITWEGLLALVFLALLELNAQ